MLHGAPCDRWLTSRERNTSNHMIETLGHAQRPLRWLQGLDHQLGPPSPPLQSAEQGELDGLGPAPVSSQFCHIPPLPGQVRNQASEPPSIHRLRPLLKC